MFSQITHHSYANGLLDASESRLPHIIIYICVHAQILPNFEHVGQNTMQFYIFRDFLRGGKGPSLRAVGCSSDRNKEKFLVNPLLID